MTEYQKIENELQRLGWTPEPSKGDHFKFRKAGEIRFINVSMSVGTSPRSIENAYAKIRQIEPNFRLGKSGTADAEENVVRDVESSAIPEWMRPGMTVRWTGPEGKDYTKLAEANSLMNQRYTVLTVATEEGRPVTATIRDAEEKHPSFDVLVEELDAWETGTCSECGKALPSPLLHRKDDGTLICQDCLDDITARIETEKAEEQRKLDMNTEMAALSRAKSSIDEFHYKYKDVQIGKLPERERVRIIKEYEKILYALPSKIRNRMLEEMPEIAVLLADKKQKTTPFQAWTMFLNSVLKEYPVFDEKYRSRKEFDNLRKRIFGCSYSIRTLVDRKTGDSTPLIHILAKDAETARIIWSFHDTIFKCFRRVYPTEVVPVILLEQPSFGIRQYLVHNWVFAGKQFLDALRKVLDEKDVQDCLTRSSLDSAMPTVSEVFEGIETWAQKATGISKEEYTVTTNPFDITVARAVRDEDSEDFQSAPAFYKARVVYNDVDYPADKYGLLLEAMKFAAPGTVPCPMELSLERMTDKDVSGKNQARLSTVPSDYWDLYDSRDVTPAAEVSCGFSYGDTLFSVVQDKAAVRIYFNHDNNPLFVQEYGERLQKAFGAILYDTDSVVTRALVNALFEIKERSDKPDLLKRLYEALAEYQDKNDNDYNMKSSMSALNVLDRTNPLDSADERLADITTRDLLRELKSRGVSFSNLEITVRETINLEEI